MTTTKEQMIKKGADLMQMMFEDDAWQDMLEDYMTTVDGGNWGNPDTSDDQLDREMEFMHWTELMLTPDIVAEFMRRMMMGAAQIGADHLLEPWEIGLDAMWMRGRS